VKILSLITRLYAHGSTVILRGLSLVVIPPGVYAINRDIKSRTQKLLDSLPGDTSQYCDVLPGNARNNKWVADLLNRFIGYSPRGITINDNTLSITRTSGLLITRYIFTGRRLILLSLRTSHGYLLTRTELARDLPEDYSEYYQSRIL
jgi:hypothetical protein